MIGSSFDKCVLLVAMGLSSADCQQNVSSCSSFVQITSAAVSPEVQAPAERGAKNKYKISKAETSDDHVTIFQILKLSLLIITFYVVFLRLFFHSVMKPIKILNFKDKNNEEGAATNYLQGLAKAFTKDNNNDDLMTEKFPMHCVRIEDLLEFDKLPSHAEVQRMNKFVIPDRSDTRKILFISHQWCGFKEPDPSNLQFLTLKAALKNLLAGRRANPSPILAELPGAPKSMKFDEKLKGCLVWIDYFGVPQVSAVESPDKRNTTHANMLKAISSLAAYVARSSLFFVLAPVIAHHDIANHDCEYSTWMRRGWCR